MSESAGRLQQAMETSFPGSSATHRRFDVDVTELAPGSTSAVGGIEVTSWEVNHPSGAPPLALRLGIGGTIIAYTGDTAWSENLAAATEDRFSALGAARADAMVLDGNDLGQSLWRASGYRRQDDWRRWVKELGPTGLLRARDHT
jgi:ribonuclease BN (tRNA processing enzyme)